MAAFDAIDAAAEARMVEFRQQHATMLSRRDRQGRPLYAVTSGGNIRRTRKITARLKAKVLDRDGNACVECGSAPSVLHIAHIEAYCINGNNDLANLRTLCPSCHAAEGVPCAIEV